MLTTLQLDDDVLAAARVLARQSQSTIGDVISDLARLDQHEDAGRSLAVRALELCAGMA